MTNLEAIKTDIKNKKIDESILLLKKILKKNLQNIEAIFLLAFCFEEKKLYEQSIAQYELLINKNETSFFLSRLASLYLKINKPQLAIIHYERSIKAGQALADVYNNYGLLLFVNKQEEEGINNIKKAMDIDDMYMDAKYNYLELNEKSNKLEKINKFIFSLNIKHPLNNIFKIYKAIILKNKKLFNLAEDELNNTEFKNTSKWQVKKLNLLGEINYELKNYKQSFIYYERCNELLKNTFHKDLFAKKIYTKKLEGYLKMSQKSYDNKIKNYDDLNSLVFLVGFPRSGTTLLDNILGSHKDISVIEEEPMIYNSLKHLPESQHINLDIRYLNEVKKNYLNELRKHCGSIKKEKLLIDKMPLNLIYLRTINSIFPKAKIIFTLRHPLDSILSCYFQHFTVNEAMVTFLGLKDTANLYNLALSISNNYKEIPSKNIYKIKYENIIEDFDNQLKSLISFLNLDWDENIHNYSLLAKSKKRIRTASYNQVIKPLYSESKYKWTNYKEELSGSKKIINKWINYYGY